MRDQDRQKKNREIRSYDRADSHKGRPCKGITEAAVAAKEYNTQGRPCKGITEAGRWATRIYYICCTYPLAGAAFMAVRSVVRPNLCCVSLF